MSEEFVDTGPVRLCYETFGTSPDPVVVLVMGLGLQMIWWRDEFCADLAGRGFRVVRFDNRDVGRSSRVPGPGVSAIGLLRRKAPVTYTIEDMADDAGALIAHAAGPEGAHVVGVSLGSFIAQATAIRHPERVRSLVSIMGRPGDGRTGKVAWRRRVGFLRPGSGSPEESLVRTFRRIGSVGRTEVDDEEVRALVRRSGERSPDDSGGGRQLAAILAESDRTAGLGGLRIPALVIHGDRDRIVLPSGGRATAAAIPGVELAMVPGMGHDLARVHWPEILDGIERTARRVR